MTPRRCMYGSRTDDDGKARQINYIREVRPLQRRRRGPRPKRICKTPPLISWSALAPTTRTRRIGFHISVECFATHLSIFSTRGGRKDGQNRQQLEVAGEKYYCILLVGSGQLDSPATARVDGVSSPKTRRLDARLGTNGVGLFCMRPGTARTSEVSAQEKAEVIRVASFLNKTVQKLKNGEIALADTLSRQNPI